MNAPSHVLSGLMSKRAELAGEIEETKRILACLISDIDAIDRAIRIFDPQIDVLAIPAKKMRLYRNSLHLGADVGRAVLAILREAATPLSVNKVTERLAADRGLGLADDRIAAAARKRVYNVLRRYAIEGVLRSSQAAGEVMTWEITA